MTTDTASKFTLRPYQQEAIDAIRRDFDAGHKSVLLVLPTGAGKTVVFSEFIRTFEGRVLVLAHRKDLVNQAAKSLSRHLGERVGIEMAGQRALTKPEDEHCRVVVGSIQSIRLRLKAVEQDHFDLVVIDEAHHSLATTYQDIIAHFEGALALGVTATPGRGRSAFEKTCYEMTLKEAIDGGILCPIRPEVVIVGADFKEVKRRLGDFHLGQMEAALGDGPTLAQVAKPVIERRGDRPALVFGVSVAHARALARKMCEMSGDDDFAIALSGEDNDEERERATDALRTGKTKVLVNCALFTEGWDFPPISLVAVARPTMDETLYYQMIGRGTRLSPETGKSDCLVLDFFPRNASGIFCGLHVAERVRREGAAGAGDDISRPGFVSEELYANLLETCDEAEFVEIMVALGRWPGWAANALRERPTCASDAEAARMADITPQSIYLLRSKDGGFSRMWERAKALSEECREPPERGRDDTQTDFVGSERVIKKKVRFLKLLKETGNVTRARDECDASRTTVYRWKSDDRLFSDAWDEVVGIHSGHEDNVGHEDVEWAKSMAAARADGDTRHWSALSPEERKARSAERRADRLARTFTAQLPTVRNMAERVADAARFYGVTTGDVVEKALLSYMEKLEVDSGRSFPRPKATMPMMSE